jgi:hypothetical protein
MREFDRTFPYRLLCNSEFYNLGLLVSHKISGLGILGDGMFRGPEN